MLTHSNILAADTPTLATQINEAHARCLQSANQALDSALECGLLLAEAKSQCGHGDWQKWLEENFAGSARTARLYLQLDRHRDRIEAKRQRVAILGIAEAAKLVSHPRYEPESIDEILSGPFCQRDFEAPDSIHWLTFKIAHHVKLPTVAHFALTSEIKTDPPMLRVVSDEDLFEAIKLMLPCLTGSWGFSGVGLRPDQTKSIELLAGRLGGAILSELEHRYGPSLYQKDTIRCLSYQQQDAEAKIALEEFDTLCRNSLTQLGVSA